VNVAPAQICATAEVSNLHDDRYTGNVPAGALYESHRRANGAARGQHVVQHENARTGRQGVRTHLKSGLAVLQRVAFRQDLARELALFADGPPQPGLETTWSERIFQYDERAARDWEAAGKLDITGRPRILVYGPYLALPAGVWKARVRFAVDEQASKREFRIDWGAPADFKSTSVSPKEPGVYEVEMEHSWPDSAMAEIRLLVMEGAFDGRLDFLGATVSYVSEPQLTLA
jgi:hypothetical protein